MSEKDDYFNYVSSVLGVKSVYIESEDVALTAAVGEVIPLVVGVENLSQYSAEEKDLLEKMIAALKIPLDKIKIFDLAVVQTNQQIQFEYFLAFAENPQQTNAKNENSLSTYSPRILLQNAALKKQAWNDLQKVIKYFSN